MGGRKRCEVTGFPLKRCSPVPFPKQMVKQNLALNIHPLVLVSFLGRTIARCRSLATPLVSKLHLALSTLGVGSFSIFDRRESPPWIDEPSWPAFGLFWDSSRVGKGRVGLVSGIFSPTTLEQISSNHQLGKFGHLQLELYPKTHQWGSMLHFNLWERIGFFYLQCDKLYWASLAVQIGSIDTCHIVFSTARGNNDNTLIS